MRLLHDGATYAQALQSRIEREMEEQRRADDAAALAKAKPKGPPAHLVGTETIRRLGGWVPGGAGYQLRDGPLARAVGRLPATEVAVSPSGSPWSGGVRHADPNQSQRRRDEPTNAGMPSASRCTSQAPISGAPRSRTPSGNGSPTLGRMRNAWKQRLRLGRTSRRSASRPGSSSGPCRPRHVAAGSPAILRRAPPPGSAGAL